jgi:type II secretory pathway pseudopilin PulG
MPGALSISRPLRNGWDPKCRPKKHPRKPSEDGYILIAVVFMLALFIIALAVAAPRVAKSIQREREIETMHRGKQYIRAVKLYYRKFGRYPPNVDALVNTSQIRFLRKKYVDPTTGKEDWKPIAVGMNKTQSTGFFGQPIVGSGSIGLSGSPGGTPSSLTGSTSLSSTSSASTADPSAASAPATDANGNPIPGATASATASTTGSTTSSTFGSGPTLGGIGIMGFSPTSPKQSILVWHKKNHYNEWEFFYDPAADQTRLSNNTSVTGQPAASTSNSSFGNSTTTPSSTSGANSTPSSSSP